MKTNISRFPALSLAVAAMLVTLNAQQSTASAQNIFVSVNDTVLEFDPSGSLIMSNNLAALGLGSPYGLAFDRSGNLYVANNVTTGGGPNGKVSVFDSSGNLINGSFTSGGLYSPYGLAFDRSGNLYVAEYGNNKVREFNSSGALINTIPSPPMPPTGYGLAYPAGLAFDSNGNLYVANANGGANMGVNAVSEFDSSGKWISVISALGLRYPYGLAFDPSGSLYVSERSYSDAAIWEFNSSGTLIHTITNPSFGLPSGLACDSSGNLYVANGVTIGGWPTGMVLEFNSSGTLIQTITNAALNYYPTFIAISPPPQLGTATAAGNKIVLCWPSTASTWILQTSTNLCGTNWTDCAGSPVISGGQCLVTNVMSGNAAFYRLRKP